MGDISLNRKQQRKLEVVARLTSGKLTEEEAAAVLRCSVRTIRRLLQRWEERGASCVLHGNSGRTPVHKTAADLRERILEMAGEGGKYHDFNVCHLESMLRRHENLAIGRSTLDRLLKEAGVRKPNNSNRTSRRRIFRRRQRSAQEGFMLLIDGSLHKWLEDRGPKLCLIAAIDDATGKVLFLGFWPTECLAGYLTMLEGIAREHGLPTLFYHDKHTILRSPKQATIEDELSAREPKSQFQEVLSLLGVEGIAAHSPQAKGRIERLFGTLQQRLVKELRLAGAATRDEANAFLPTFIADYNEEFAVPAADAEAAWVKVDAKTDFAYYFAAREQRTVRADHTVSWLGRTLAIERSAEQPSLANKKVNVHIDAREQLFLYWGKTPLKYRYCEKDKAAAEREAPTKTAAKEPGASQPNSVNRDEQPARPQRQRPSDAPGTRAWLYAAARAPG